MKRTDFGLSTFGLVKSGTYSLARNGELRKKIAQKSIRNRLIFTCIFRIE